MKSIFRIHPSKSGRSRTNIVDFSTLLPQFAPRSDDYSRFFYIILQRRPFPGGLSSIFRLLFDFTTAADLPTGETPGPKHCRSLRMWYLLLHYGCGCADFTTAADLSMDPRQPAVQMCCNEKSTARYETNCAIACAGHLHDQR